MLSCDQCVIKGQYFFIRGLVEIPVIGSQDAFSRGAWPSLSRENMRVPGMAEEAGLDAPRVEYGAQPRFVRGVGGPTPRPGRGRHARSERD
ncbi:DUF2199 domain-containing protein [Streptomyces sp. NPDC059957]|uniref:DUF2199 domain-containing protein n=1 Tax=unclassified Streptomyces TaxID=2593676 RepID=UPI0036496BEF